MGINIFVIYALCFFAAAEAIRKPLPDGNFTDHYVLVLQWPPAITSDPNVRREFTIHGLWPGDSSKLGTPLRECIPGSTLSKSSIKALLRTLNWCWPNLESNDNMWFWTSQWKSHGTCSAETPSNYFGTAIKLIKQLKLDSTLKSAQLLYGPYPRVSYSHILFLDAFKQQHGKNARIVCIDQRLVEFRINFTNDASPILQDMQPPYTQGCNGKIGFEGYLFGRFVGHTTSYLSISEIIGLYYFNYGYQ